MIAYVCKYLTITPTIRVTFENLPVILSGFAFGPVTGMLTGLGADILNTAVSQYGIAGINPIITAGAGLVGLTAGVTSRLLQNRRITPRLACAVFASHAAGNMVLKSVGLHVYYGTPYSVLALRVPLYLAIAAAEFALLYTLLKSGALRRTLRIRDGSSGAAREVEYVHSLEKFGSRPGLETITELCRRLGDPQDKLKFVHVAGTNGKGSVSAMLTAVLGEGGRRVGRYTSPYVLRFNERIAVGDRPISDADLVRVIRRVRRAARGMERPVTEFEFITAAAFVYFAKKKCDVVVLEVGLGGRLDATNVIKTPVLSVICGIDLDHTAVLGGTVAEIAAEKGGIIKDGVPLVCGEMPDEAADVLRGIANEKNAPVIFADLTRLHDGKVTPDGCEFGVRDCGEKLFLPLVGEHQMRNAMTAVTAAEALGSTAEEIARGLARVRWKARFETLTREPTVIYDGAHNPQGARAARAAVEAVFPGQKPLLLTATMSDKDYRSCAAEFAAFASRVYCVSAGSPRSLGAAELAAVYAGLGVSSEAFGSVEEALFAALREAKSAGLPLVCAGTLYAYADVVRALEKAAAQGLCVLLTT